MSRPIDLDAVRAARRRLDALAARHPELTTDTARARCAAWLTREEVAMAKSKATTDLPTAAASSTYQAAFRLPGALLARLDAFAARLRADHPGVAVTRTDAVRLLLTRGLERVERGEAT